MNDSLNVIIISSIVTLIGGLITLLVTKLLEARQKKVDSQDSTKGALALAKFGQEETIRKEMQLKIDRMDTTINRLERAFGTLRDSVNDILRETLMTMQLAMHDIKTGHSEEALTKLEEGVKRIKAMKLPELPPVDEGK